MSNNFTIVVEGAGGVGKSALTAKYCNNTFLEHYDPTIEDAYRKLAEVDGKACILDIIDTAGQENYTSLRDHYTKTADGILLVFSVTTETSFEMAVKIHKTILRIRELTPDLPILLVGNKIDMEKERVVDNTKAVTTAANLNCAYIETSAKMGVNVKEAFHQLVRMIAEWRMTNMPSQGKGDKKSKKCYIM